MFRLLKAAGLSPDVTMALRQKSAGRLTRADSARAAVKGAGRSKGRSASGGLEDASRLEEQARVLADTAMLLDVFTAATVNAAARAVDSSITKPRAIREATQAALRERVRVEKGNEGTRMVFTARADVEREEGIIRVPPDPVSTRSGKRPRGRAAGTITEGTTFLSSLTVDFDADGKPVRAETALVPTPGTRPEPYIELLVW